MGYFYSSEWSQIRNLTDRTISKCLCRTNVVASTTELSPSMVFCASCLYPIQKAKCSDVHCGMCSREFHLKCVNLSEQGLVFLKEMKKPFICLDCMRAAEGRGPPVISQPPFATQPTQPPMGCQNPLQKDRITLNDLIQAIKSNTERLNTFIEGQNNHLSALHGGNKDVVRSLECCHEMIQSNNNAINILHVKVDHLSTQLTDVKRDKCMLESRIKDLEEFIGYLKTKLSEQSPAPSRSETPPMLKCRTRSRSQPARRAGISTPLTPPDLMNDMYDKYNDCCY